MQCRVSVFGRGGRAINSCATLRLRGTVTIQPLYAAIPYIVPKTFRRIRLRLSGWMFRVLLYCVKQRKDEVFIASLSLPCLMHVKLCQAIPSILASLVSVAIGHKVWVNMRREWLARYLARTCLACLRCSKRPRHFLLFL